MSFNKFAVGTLLAATCIGGALACGPSFPGQLLDYRGMIVESVSLSFSYEASRLVTAPVDGLRAIERDEPMWPGDGPEAAVIERQEARSGAWKAIVSPIIDQDTLLSKLEAARGSATTRNSSRNSASGTSRAEAGGASTTTPRCALPPTAS